MTPAPMPIIVGAPRSGTTLLRFMLDSHSDVAIPPETGFLSLAPQFACVGETLREEFFRAVIGYPLDAPAWQDFGISREAFRAELGKIEPFTVSRGYRAFYRLYATRFGKQRWGDKTPSYCHSMGAIESVLPEAHFIHIIRDGRDVAMSLRPMWFAPGRDIETLADHWSQFVSSARLSGVSCRHYLEVGYEALVLNTRLTLERVCQFLDLPFDESMLTYYERTPERLHEHETRLRADGRVLVTKEERFLQQQKTTEPPDPKRVFNWKVKMSGQDCARFEAVAGSLLRELGYDATGE
jgi:sulfotransferase family protein